MIYYADTNENFTVSTEINAGRRKSGKEYIYCAICYHNPKEHVYIRRKYPASQFHFINEWARNISAGKYSTEAIKKSLEIGMEGA